MRNAIVKGDPTTGTRPPLRRLRSVAIGSETQDDLRFSLDSAVCPGCGGRKDARLSVCCPTCFSGFDADVRRALIRTSGPAYAAAFRRAFQAAGKADLFLPREARP